MTSYKFQIGDKVEWYLGGERGTVVGLENEKKETLIKWDDGNYLQNPYFEDSKYLRLIENGIDKLDDIL